MHPGETLAAIGRLYGVNWHILARVNQLADPDHLEVGQSIWIPVAPGQASHDMPTLVVPSALVPGRLLEWPTQGLMSSGFGTRGGRLHAGIDISAGRDTPIVAAADGIVIFSGRGPHGYGNTVMLYHGKRLLTLYAHNDRNVVHQGQRVQRGQIIAFVGETGRASGTHLHFEVHQDGRLVDPLRWLP